MRVNYIKDSRDPNDRVNLTENASRGDSGVFVLDTARVNLDFKQDKYIGKFEYRWYEGWAEVEAYTNYSFIHTAWLGYAFDEKSQLEVGITRVPFGPTNYGVSESWFFDQHFYVGLADDMDLGVKYSSEIFENLKIDVGYFYGSEGSGIGDGGESVRYAYDVVDEFHERDQINLRALYQKKFAQSSHELGISLLYSRLESQREGVKDGDRYAISLHNVTHYNDFTLKTQLTRYEMRTGSNLVTMGGFNYGEGVAAKAWIPAFSLSYKYETSQLDWLDYLRPYIEYSNIIKDESSFNNSDMMIIGAAWARQNWYIYSDFALANGNYFVGPYTGKDGGTNNFGANSSHNREHRFNVNLGYYF